MPGFLTVEQTVHQTVVGGPGDHVVQSGNQNLPGDVPFRRNVLQRFSQDVFPADCRHEVPGGGGPAGGSPPPAQGQLPSGGPAGGSPRPAQAQSPSAEGGPHSLLQPYSGAGQLHTLAISTLPAFGLKFVLFEASESPF